MPPDLDHRVRRHTTVVSPWLCPELRLHLASQASPLWRATEEEAASWGVASPYWAFAWAGGQALARYVLDHPEAVAGRSVLDFGSGSGLVAVACARAGARRVLAADLDPLAGHAARLNAALNGVNLETTERDLVGEDPSFEAVLAGDVLYDEGLLRRVGPWLRALARRGALVLLGDPGRGFSPHEADERLASYLAPSDVDVDGTCLRPTQVLRLSPDPG